MEYTNNYNLKKPHGVDKAQIVDINNNMDTIDSALTTLQSSVNNLDNIIVNGIKASTVVESEDKQFVTKVEKEQIHTNTKGLHSKIDKSLIGIPNGVAKLNSNGQVVNSNGTSLSNSKWEDFED